MDEIVAAVVAKLLLREKQSLTVNAASFNPEERSQRDFLHHKTIRVESLGAIQLAKVAKLDCCDPLTCWLLKGIELNCHVTLSIGFSIVSLIPKEIFDWPVVIKTHKNQQLRTFHHKIISYQDVALLAPSDILVRFPEQQLTGLAKDFMNQNKIQEIVRY